MVTMGVETTKHYGEGIITMVITNENEAREVPIKTISKIVISKYPKIHEPRGNDMQFSQKMGRIVPFIF